MSLYRNVGGVDRGLRITLGTILLPIGLWMVRSGCRCGWVDVVLGVMGLASGLSGFCILYLPFGISTARTKTADWR